MVKKCPSRTDVDDDEQQPEIVTQLDRLSETNSFWDYVTYTPKDKSITENFHLKTRAFFRFLLQRRASLQLQKSLVNSQHPDLPTNPKDIQLLKEEIDQGADSLETVTETLVNGTVG